MIVEFSLGGLDDEPLCAVEMPHAPSVGDDICIQVKDQPGQARRFKITSIIWWLGAAETNPKEAKLDHCMAMVSESDGQPSNVIEMKQSEGARN
jgi:hypothetical protein